jgi:hypothetical protein
MIAHARERGLAVPETALVISFALLMLNAVVGLAQLNFMQLSADGATFVASHDVSATTGAPTTADVGGAQSAATGAFKKVLASAISVAVPNKTTFETDVTQNVPGFSTLGLSPAIAVQSRLIEQTSGGAAAGSAGDCILSKTDIGSATSKTLGPTVALVNGPSLVSMTGASGTVTTTLNLDTTGAVSRDALLASAGTALQNVVQSIYSVNATLGITAGAGPLGTTLTAQIAAPLGKALAAQVQNALTGTYSAGSALSTVNSALTTALPQLGLPLPLGGTLLSTVVDPALTNSNTVTIAGQAGPVTTTGILSTSSPLSTLNGLEQQLTTIDNAAATTCPAFPALP